MRHPIEIKEEILKLQAALDELKEEYILAKARARAEIAEAKAAEAAKDVERLTNVFATRREKRREKLLRELNEI